MRVKIKKIEYLIPPKDIFNNALNVFVSLRWVLLFYRSDNTSIFIYYYGKREQCFLLPDYPCVIVSKLTDNILRVPIESFINSDDEMRCLKLYHIISKLSTQEINEILSRKKQEDIELDAEFEEE